MPEIVPTDSHPVKERVSPWGTERKPLRISKKWGIEVTPEVEREWQKLGIACWQDFPEHDISELKAKTSSEAVRCARAVLTNWSINLKLPTAEERKKMTEKTLGSEDGRLERLWDSLTPFIRKSLDQAKIRGPELLLQNLRNDPVHMRKEVLGGAGRAIRFLDNLLRDGGFPERIAKSPPKEGPVEPLWRPYEPLRSQFAEIGVDSWKALSEKGQENPDALVFMTWPVVCRYNRRFRQLGLPAIGPRRKQGGQRKEVVAHKEPEEAQELQEAQEIPVAVSSGNGLSEAQVRQIIREEIFRYFPRSASRRVMPRLRKRG